MKIYRDICYTDEPLERKKRERIICHLYIRKQEILSSADSACFAFVFLCNAGTSVWRNHSIFIPKMESDVREKSFCGI